MWKKKKKMLPLFRVFRGVGTVDNVKLSLEL